MRAINKGENVIIRRNLQKADGSNLLLSETTSIKVDIIQRGHIIDSLTYPSTYLREGKSTHQLELEITTANSEKFTTGTVSLKYTLIFSNGDFAEGIQKDIIEEQALTVK